ncbi:MAG: hypothetical protein H6767_02925 [Candidatus Peribacteria bacterium]|nr:MAG: hypothetical protein H6767_02925 [Candidatus Peribacteria bacterium]
MKTFSRFFFESYHFDTQSLQATFCYSFDENQFFEEVVQFRDEHFSVRMDLDMEVIDAMMFQISLALGVSYYKLQPVSELIVKTGKLTSDQCHFWKKFYTLGLGEFLYTHDLSPDVIGEFSSVSEEQKIAPDFPVSHRSLVPLG